jgi:hypothetical protein
MQAEFVAKVEQLTAETDSDLVLILRPVVTRMPMPIRRYDDPFFPFGRAVVSASREHVCGYLFDVAAYLAIGAAGAIALERTLSYIAGERLAVLHGPFVGGGFAHITDENAFQADAVTLADDSALDRYLQRSDRSAFIHTDDEINLNDSRHLQRGAGLYLAQRGQLTLTGSDSEVITLHLAGDDILYAATGDDFADQLAQALAQLKQGGRDG